MTTLREFLQHRRRAEYPVFVKVLKALPLDRFDYHPHERSPSAAQIIWTLALETKACCDLIDSGRTNYKADPPPENPEIIVAAFERHSADLNGRVEGLDENDWQKKVQFLVNDKLTWEAPLGDILWFLFFDAIHHRGQLSTYIRPMGGHVPSIYGPSGDEPGVTS
jgi:uncharacterized damage-inducible protein DinB